MLSEDGLRIALPEGLHAFVRLVLVDPAVQARLGAEIEADGFACEALEVAAEHGVALDRALLAKVLRPDPIGLGRFAVAPVEFDGWPPAGWLPARTVETGGAPAFDWLWFGARRLTSSFFADEVSLANALPLNWLLRIRTGLDAVMAGAGEEAALPLSGLIYHMSRCGSTLLAQMLAANPANAVLSEPGPLDDLLLWAWREQLSPEAAAPAVRAIVAALGRQRGLGEERLFIKADAWHTLLMPQLLAAFPEVPWVYLFRDPLEVLVSHQKMPGIQIVAGIMPETLFGISGGLDMPPLEYAARALQAIGEAAIAQAGLGNGMFVAYPDLVTAAPTRIAAHFELALNAPGQAAMRAAATVDSKSRAVPFAADSQAKRAAASPALQQIVVEILTVTNVRLESLR